MTDLSYMHMIGLKQSKHTTHVLESISYSCSILNSISVQFSSPIRARGLSLMTKNKVIVKLAQICELGKMYRWIVTVQSN